MLVKVWRCMFYTKLKMDGDAGKKLCLKVKRHWVHLNCSRTHMNEKIVYKGCVFMPRHMVVVPGDVKRQSRGVQSGKTNPLTAASGKRPTDHRRAWVLIQKLATFCVEPELLFPRQSVHPPQESVTFLHLRMLLSRSPNFSFAFSSLFIPAAENLQNKINQINSSLNFILKTCL